MLISMIICTRNRADQLRSVLESASGMAVPHGLQWELIVVDNGSGDHTRDVVASFTDRLPVRYVHEGEAGLSRARNRGVAEARGAYICWTDDDVVIDRQWLSAYAQAFSENPDKAFFGGPIELALEEPVPLWLKENRQLLGGTLAERHLGEEPVALSAPDGLPYGANFAVRTSEQREHLYDPCLGVSPTQQRLGEESVALTAISRAGGTGLWVPSARVLHLIPRERLTLDYFLRYQRSSGETAVYLAERGQKELMQLPFSLTGPRVAGVPARLWFLAAAHWLLYKLLRPVARSSTWLRPFLRYGLYSGAIRYLQAEAPAERPMRAG